jgi:exopolysaccharide biosynthesis operon protein EpsL
MTALFTRKLIVAVLFCSGSSNLYAEGIIDFRPTIGVETTYDDNVFRFSTPQQAKAVFGSSVTSDTILRKEIGLDVDLRLSRQLISLTSNINKSEYNRFDQLNNIGKSFGLVWDWQLGNDFFGEVGVSDSEALSGFNDLRTTSANIRSDKQRFARANWRLHPSWIANVSVNTSITDNSLEDLNFFNNENEAYEAGVQYINPRGTRLSLAYRNSTRFYKNNTIDRLVFFGDKNTKNEVILNASWEPTTKIRLITRLSQVDLAYNNLEFSNVLPERSFSGLNKRLSINYLASAKTNISFIAYDEIFEWEELSSTFVKSKGFSINPTWKPTEKLNLTANWEINEREFLGDSGIASISTFSFIERDDRTESASVSLAYLPTNKSLLRVTYSNVDRTSKFDAFSFKFNILNLSLRYFF